MAVVVKTPAEVVYATVTALGLDADTLDLNAPEALAELIRRAASFLCPTTSRRLVDTVVDAIHTLVKPPDDLRQTCRKVIESLVSYGDLVELAADPTNRTVRQFYLGTPTYIPINSHAWVVTGIKPDGRPLLGEQLRSRIEPERHVRRVDTRDLDDPEGLAAASGLHYVSLAHYIRQPTATSASTFIRKFDNQLSSAPLGNADVLRLLDPKSSPRYYPGRWRIFAPTDSGKFVARRAQAYGSDLGATSESRRTPSRAYSTFLSLTRPRPAATKPGDSRPLLTPSAGCHSRLLLNPLVGTASFCSCSHRFRVGRSAVSTLLAHHS